MSFSEQSCSQVKRNPFAGALAIARYNWPFYAAAILVVVGSVLVLGLFELPGPMVWILAFGAMVAGWLAMASFLASHWVFDRSGLAQWRWLGKEFQTPPAKWVHITAGLDETAAPLEEVFPGTNGKVLDIYDPKTMTEPAIARARELKEIAEGKPSELVLCNALPVEDAWADAIFLLLTAHEVRQPESREAFFREIARILAPQGKIVVVEHLRDLPNCLAFGPGFFHFLPRREWLRLGKVAGLIVNRERSFTPFVRVFVFQHPQSLASDLNSREKIESV